MGLVTESVVGFNADLFDEAIHDMVFGEVVKVLTRDHLDKLEEFFQKKTGVTPVYRCKDMYQTFLPVSKSDDLSHINGEYALSNIESATKSHGIKIFLKIAEYNSDNREPDVVDLDELIKMKSRLPNFDLCHFSDLHQIMFSE